MHDTKIIESAHERHQQNVAQANFLNKTAVFDALVKAGVTRVTVDFDGEGDSGQIENLQAYTGDAPAQWPAVTVECQRAVWNNSRLDAASLPLQEAVETLCYDYLEQEHGGWENNDGAYGEFTFHVAEQRIELSFHARFVDSFHTASTF